MTVPKMYKRKMLKTNDVHVDGDTQDKHDLQAAESVVLTNEEPLQSPMNSFNLDLVKYEYDSPIKPSLYNTDYVDHSKYYDDNDYFTTGGSPSVADLPPTPRPSPTGSNCSIGTPTSTKYPVGLLDNYSSVTPSSTRYPVISNTYASYKANSIPKQLLSNEINHVDGTLPVTVQPSNISPGMEHITIHPFQNFHYHDVPVSCTVEPYHPSPFLITSNNSNTCAHTRHPDSYRGTHAHTKYPSQPNNDYYLNNIKPIRVKSESPYSVGSSRSTFYPGYPNDSYKTNGNQSQNTPYICHYSPDTPPHTMYPPTNNGDTEDEYKLNANRILELNRKQMIELNRKREVEFQQREYAANMVKTLEHKKESTTLSQYEATMLFKYKEYLYSRFQMERLSEVDARTPSRTMNRVRSSRVNESSRLTPPLSPSSSIMGATTTTTTKRGKMKKKKELTVRSGKPRTIRYSPY